MPAASAFQTRAMSQALDIWPDTPNKDCALVVSHTSRRTGEAPITVYWGSGAIPWWWRQWQVNWRAAAG